MIEVKTSVKMRPHYLTDQMKKNLPKAKYETLHEIIEDTEPYIPYDTGRLNDSVGLNIERGTIIYDTPYAAFAFNPMYKGKTKLYNREHHPLAQGNPYKESQRINKKKWAETFKRVLTEGLNNDR